MLWKNKQPLFSVISEQGIFFRQYGFARKECEFFLAYSNWKPWTHRIKFLGLANWIQRASRR